MKTDEDDLAPDEIEMIDRLKELARTARLTDLCGMKKSEQIARWFLGLLAAADYPFEIVTFEGEPDMRSCCEGGMTDAQIDAMFYSVLLAGGYPRLYQKVIAIAANDGLAVRKEAA